MPALEFWTARVSFPMWRRFAASIVAATISGILATIDPLLLRRLIDVAIPQHQAYSAIVLVTAIFACLAGRSVFLLATLYLNFVVQQDLAQSLRISMLEQLNRLSADYHEKTPAGEKLSRMERDVDQIAEVGSSIASSVLRAVVLFTANMIVMLQLNVAITLAVVPVALIFLFVRTRFGGWLRQTADFAQSETGRASSMLNEYLTGILQVQLLGAENLLVSKASKVWQEALTARKKQRSIELRYSGIVNTAVVFSTALVLGIGTLETFSHRLTIGALIAFYTCATRIFEPVSAAAEVYSQSQRVGASVRRVRAVLESDSRLPDLGRITQPRCPLTQGISVNRVSYGYRRDQHALHEFSLQMAPTDTIAIVGPSGSGKSTLARLLARLSDPQMGEILLDGYPFRDFSIAALRTTICYLPQQPLLFDGSIAENLRLGRPMAKDEELERVVCAAQLSSVTDRLPRGLDTDIGPSGHSLSGGERQRVALARALLREAPVLVMDESTSALDLPTEQLVLEGIAQYRKNALLVLITHRVPSVRWANCIVVMSHGKIVASGKHSSLYDCCALYKSLYDSPILEAVN